MPSSPRRVWGRGKGDETASGPLLLIVVLRGHYSSVSSAEGQQEKGADRHTGGPFCPRRLDTGHQLLASLAAFRAAGSVTEPHSFPMQTPQSLLTPQSLSQQHLTRNRGEAEGELHLIPDAQAFLIPQNGIGDCGRRPVASRRHTGA